MAGRVQKAQRAEIIVVAGTHRYEWDSIAGDFTEKPYDNSRVGAVGTIERRRNGKVAIAFDFGSAYFYEEQVRRIK